VLFVIRRRIMTKHYGNPRIGPGLHPDTLWQKQVSSDSIPKGRRELSSLDTLCYRHCVHSSSPNSASEAFTGTLYMKMQIQQFGDEKILSGLPLLNFAREQNPPGIQEGIFRQ
jgi:hypothetical protein